MNRSLSRRNPVGSKGIKEVEENKFLFLDRYIDSALEGRWDGLIQKVIPKLPIESFYAIFKGMQGSDGDEKASAAEFQGMERNLAVNAKNITKHSAPTQIEHQATDLTPGNSASGVLTASKKRKRTTVTSERTKARRRIQDPFVSPGTSQPTNNLKRQQALGQSFNQGTEFATQVMQSQLIGPQNKTKPVIEREGVSDHTRILERNTIQPQAQRHSMIRTYSPARDGQLQQGSLDNTRNSGSGSKQSKQTQGRSAEKPPIYPSIT